MKAGRGEVPDWATILSMSEKWGQPPWVVEQELSEEWLVKYNAYYEEIATAEKRRRKK